MGCDFSFKSVARSCAYSVHEYFSDTALLDEVLEADPGYRDVRSLRMTSSQISHKHPFFIDLRAATFPAQTPGVYHRSLAQVQCEEKLSLQPNNLESQVASRQLEIQQSVRRERNKLISRNILIVVQKLTAQDIAQTMAQTHRRLLDERNLWKDCALRGEEKLANILIENRDCKEAIKYLEEVQDELRLTIEEEKSKLEIAVMCHKVGVSSLRDRMRSEKQRVWVQAQQQDHVLEETRQELYEARSSRVELRNRIQHLEQSLSSLRCDDTIQTLRDQICCALSHMSEVMLVRPVNGQSITENMRDLRDGVRDLVKEVISRRDNNHRLNEQIFKMKEERLVWNLGYRSYEREARGLKEKLETAVRAITELRRESGGEAGGSGDMRSC